MYNSFTFLTAISSLIILSLNALKIIPIDPRDSILCKFATVFTSKSSVKNN